METDYSNGTYKRIILFGAGNKGSEALKKYGKDCVAYFCDNDVAKIGTSIDGVEVIAFNKLTEIYSSGYVIIVTLAFPCFVIGQLENAGITDYLLYHENNPQIIKYENHENAIEKEHNDILRAYVDRTKSYDLIDDIDVFKAVCKEAMDLSKEKSIALNYKTKGLEEEGYRYGNLQTLERYANLDSVEGRYKPVVSHVCSIPIYSPIQRYKTAVIMSGSYYKYKIHENYPWVPVFTVGPYIKYAKDIYDENDFKEIKNKIGTMLLAFLPHTLENVNRKYSRKGFMDELVERYGNLYNQIWLCVYFADINDDICDYAQKRNIHIVTAGFRFDPFFNDRLKTIIELCDGVVCGDIGAFLTYAICLNKPIARIEMDDKVSLLDLQYQNDFERSIEKTKDYLKFENDFYNLFDEKIQLNEEMKEWMDPLAGYSLCKDKKYIQDVFKICNDIWNISEGNIRSYPNSVREMYYKYNEKGDFEKMHMLKQAVGNYLE